MMTDLGSPISRKAGVLSLQHHDCRCACHESWAQAWLAARSSPLAPPDATHRPPSRHKPSSASEFLHSRLILSLRKCAASCSSRSRGPDAGPPFSELPVPNGKSPNKRANGRPWRGKRPTVRPTPTPPPFACTLMAPRKVNNALQIKTTLGRQSDRPESLLTSRQEQWGPRAGDTILAVRGRLAVDCTASWPCIPVSRTTYQPVLSGTIARTMPTTSFRRDSRRDRCKPEDARREYKPTNETSKQTKEGGGGKKKTHTQYTQKQGRAEQNKPRPN
ncbi:unnamed protein product [Diplocarpon coronariae]